MGGFRPPWSHRATAWALNTALAVWVLEALLILTALLLMSRGGPAGDLAARALGKAYAVLILAPAAASALVLACVLARHSLHAESLTTFEHAWLASLLTLVLLGTTCYILMVGAHDFERNRVFVPQTVRGVQIGRDLKDPKDPFSVKLVVSESEIGPDAVRGAFREASAELSVMASLGAISAAGILVLHFLGWREGHARSKGRRRGRVPPWREIRDA